MSCLIPIAVDFGKVKAVFGSRNDDLLKLLLQKHQQELEEVDEIAGEMDQENEAEEEDDDDSRQKSLLALSQLLGKAKEGLASGALPDSVMKNLGASPDLNQQHQAMLQNLFSDSDDDDDGEEESPPASAADVLKSVIDGEDLDKGVYDFMFGYALKFICLHVGEVLPHDNWLDLRGSSWAKTLDKALKTSGIPAKMLSISKHLAGRGSPFKQIPKYDDNPSIGYLTATEIGAVLEALQNANFERVDDELRPNINDIRGWLQTCADTKRELICFGG
jgi:hypothetical protein